MCRIYIGGHSAQHKVPVFALQGTPQTIEAYAIVGLIKQLADVGTALS
jgi:hypothetical protein